jgi:hypothetical protein
METKGGRAQLRRQDPLGTDTTADEIVGRESQASEPAVTTTSGPFGASVIAGAA